VNKLRLPDPSGKLQPAKVRVAAVAEGDMANSVLFDVTGQTSDKRTYSNITPQDARVLALVLLRAAAEAEGRPLPAPADAVVSREWREVTRALREEATR
jgi:hypothetical protein